MGGHLNRLHHDQTVVLYGSTHSTGRDLTLYAYMIYPIIQLNITFNNNTESIESQDHICAPADATSGPLGVRRSRFVALCALPSDGPAWPSRWFVFATVPHHTRA